MEHEHNADRRLENYAACNLTIGQVCASLKKALRVRADHQPEILARSSHRPHRLWGGATCQLDETHHSHFRKD
jgi:hypothetical protein